MNSYFCKLKCTHSGKLVAYTTLVCSTLQEAEEKALNTFQEGLMCSEGISDNIDDYNIVIKEVPDSLFD